MKIDLNPLAISAVCRGCAQAFYLIADGIEKAQHVNDSPAAEENTGTVEEKAPATAIEPALTAQAERTEKENGAPDYDKATECIPIPAQAERTEKPTASDLEKLGKRLKDALHTGLITNSELRSLVEAGKFYKVSTVTTWEQYDVNDAVFKTVGV